LIVQNTEAIAMPPIIIMNKSL